MKKIIPFLLFALLLEGCSGLSPILDLIASPTPGIAPDTPTPQPTVTRIPTRDLFATLTPTPVTFTPTTTPFVPDQPPTETSTGIPTIAPPSSFQLESYFTPKNQGFLAVLISNPVIYWNAGPCMPRNVRITAFVEDLVHTDKVYLMLRAREKKDTLILQQWSSPAEMIKQENGSFNYNVTTDNIKRYYYHKEAWLEYQLVAVDENLQIIARTQIFDRNISLIMCRPVISP